MSDKLVDELISGSRNTYKNTLIKILILDYLHIQWTLIIL